MSNLKVNTINDASGGSAAKLYGVSMRDGGTGWVNRIINGGAQIAQRGSVSISTNSAVYGGCDRWLIGTSGFSTVSTTAAQAGSSGSSASITGFVQQIGPTNTTGSGVISLQQRIESFNTADLNSKSVTVTLTLYQDTGSTLSPTLNLYKPTAQDNWISSTFIAGTIVSLPSGVRTSFTWTTTLGASDATNGLSLQINIPCGAITGKYFQLGDVQLEAGTVASPFERRDYGRELMMCQRYAVMINSSNANGTYLRYGAGENPSTTVSNVIISLPCPMRIVPSATTPSATLFSIYSAGSAFQCTSVGIGGDGSGINSFVNVSCTVASGLTLGYASNLISNNNKTSYILFSSEL